MGDQRNVSVSNNRRVVIAIFIDSSGEPVDVIVGQLPWTRAYVINYKRIQGLNIENMYIGFNGQLRCKHGNWTDYSVFVKPDNAKWPYNVKKIIRRAYFVLGYSDTKSGRKYFITDGTQVPRWYDLRTVEHKLMVEGAGLSNAKIVRGKYDDYIAYKSGNMPELDFETTAIMIRKIRRMKLLWKRNKS